MGAQHQRPPLLLRLEIEGVHHLARRMLLRDVERAEVVEVVLDVRALGDREAHLAEDRDDLLGDLADRVNAPVGARPYRQGDVLSLGQQLGVERHRLERGLARRDGVGHRLLELIVALAGRAPRLRLERAEALGQIGDPPLLAERGDPDLLERAQIGRFGRPRSAGRAPGDPHRRPSLRSLLDTRPASKKGAAGPFRALGTWPDQPSSATWACLAKLANAAWSWTATSASTLRSISMPALFRPCISRP